MGSHLRQVSSEFIGPRQGATERGSRVAHPPHRRIRKELDLVHSPLHSQAKESPLALIAGPVELATRRWLEALDLRPPAAALAGPCLARLVLHAPGAPDIIARDVDAESGHGLGHVFSHPGGPEASHANIVRCEEEICPSLRLCGAAQRLAQPGQGAAPARPADSWPAQKHLCRGLALHLGTTDSDRRLGGVGMAHGRGTAPSRVRVRKKNAGPPPSPPA
mmetsp:Transcript_87637/g.196208  ORF Transcript_87637/g.196208 Transcript_87637/m.196208 type:complete len:220 (-) Transcript_87637:2-661(-)